MKLNGISILRILLLVFIKSIMDSLPNVTEVGNIVKT